MSREILVVKKNILFQEGEFKGFIPIEKKDFFDIIMKNYEYKERADMEQDMNYKQIVSYVILINPETKKVFFYKRSSSGYERRLHNNYSGGIGGHIDKDTEENSTNPIETAMMRELNEELAMQNYPTPKIIGWISSDAGPVERVHLGVVALAKTNEDAKPAEDMKEGKFFSVQEVEKIFANPENTIEDWTRICWPFIKEYLESI